MNVRSRPVARLIVLDPLDRILLFETRLAYTHVWMTPGGGVEPGESIAEGAHRELWEEVGVRDAELGPCVWIVHFRFEYQKEIIDQREQYFVVRLRSDEVVDTNREASERAEILQHRWWTCTEIEEAHTDFRPRELAKLLPLVIAGEFSVDPVSALVEASANVL